MNGLKLRYGAAGIALALLACERPSLTKPGSDESKAAVSTPIADRDVKGDAAVRVHVFISGVVQGVSFRASTEEQARKLGTIVGWVRNLSDGRVEGVFQGPKEKVRNLLEWCHKGPPAARVAKVETADETPADDLKGFEIKPDK